MHEYPRRTTTPVRLLGSVCALVAVLDGVGVGRAVGETWPRPAPTGALVVAHPPAGWSTVPVSPSPPRRTSTTIRLAPPRPLRAATPVHLPTPVGAVPPVGRRRPAAQTPSTPPPGPPVPAPAPPPPSSTTTVAPRPAPPSRPPAPADPPRSIPPDQAFETACWTSTPITASCNRAALADIDKARSGEGLGALQLPSDFSTLTVPAQLIAVANAERTSRGLPALSERTQWDDASQQGARSGQDPTGPSDAAWASNYAIGDPTALSADYSWMYDDGAGSNNVDCSASHPSGCWGHRHNILSPWGGTAGGGMADTSGGVALAELFVEG